MAKYKKIFEFTYTLIDAQIEKYKKLADFGVGPDARMNASLVLDEVNELIACATQLLAMMEQPSSEREVEINFLSIFNQVRFYVEQEHARAYAGWLIDENNIHTGVYSRVKAQLEQLDGLAKAANIDISTPAEPMTDTQKQCLHDSNAIAYKILNLAMQLIKNPTIDVKTLGVQDHAQVILKRHVSTPSSRYFNPDIATPIKTLFKKHKQFLDTSSAQTSENTLGKDLAIDKSKQHGAQQAALLARYKKLNPASSLFAEKTRQVAPRQYGIFPLVTASAAALLLLFWLYQFVAQTETPLQGPKSTL